MVHEIAEAPFRGKVLEDRDERIATESSTYRNAGGEEICEARFELRYNEDLRKDEVLSLFLRGPDGRDVDVLSLLGLPEGVRILLDKKASPYHDRKKNVIFVNGVETPLQLVTLAHEIGHAIQGRDPVYAELLTEYNSHKKNLTGDPFGGETLRVVQKYVPDHGISLPVMDELIGLGGRYDALVERNFEISKDSGKETVRSGKLLDAYAFAAMTTDFGSVIPARQLFEQRGLTFLHASSTKKYGSRQEILKDVACDVIGNSFKGLIDTAEGVRHSGFYRDGVFYEVITITSVEDERFEAVFTVDLSLSENPLAVAARQSADRILALEKERGGLLKEIGGIEDEYAIIAEPHSETISQILRIPTVVLERDATRRALESLRVLKQKFGIDLLQELDRDVEESKEVQKWGESRLKGGGDSVTIQKLGNTFPDTVQYLNACLDTHTADSQTNRGLYGKSLRARMPSPKGKETEL